MIGVVGQNKHLLNSFQRIGGIVSQHHQIRNLVDSLLIEQHLECPRKFSNRKLSKSFKDFRRRF